jgi:hypothetical protein
MIMIYYFQIRIECINQPTLEYSYYIFRLLLGTCLFLVKFLFFRAFTTNSSQYFDLGSSTPSFRFIKQGWPNFKKRQSDVKKAQSNDIEYYFIKKVGKKKSIEPMIFMKAPSHLHKQRESKEKEDESVFYLKETARACSLRSKSKSAGAKGGGDVVPSMWRACGGPGQAMPGEARRAKHVAEQRERERRLASAQAAAGKRRLLRQRRSKSGRGRIWCEGSRGAREPGMKVEAAQ